MIIVDKNLFTSLLQRYTDSSLAEAEEVVALKAEYPYSQLLHTLAARVSKDHGFNFHQQELQLAAIHAADRGVLKEIITAEAAEPEPEPAPANTYTPVTIQEAPSATPEFKIQRNDSADVADELMRDLDKLNTLKSNFEMLLVEYSEVQSEETAAPAMEEPAPLKAPVQASEPASVKRTPTVKEAVPEHNEPDGQDAAPAPKPKGKSKKQRIIELAKAMNEAETEEKDLEEKDKKERAGARIANPSDELIEEIRVSKEEIVPESDKQREQMAIINNFIKTQPSITNARERQSHASGDLATIKSGEFGDNIVSETLVEILIRQGKKDKAIEVLKKLIWKYPQKKSYFASQIEDLKK